MVELEYTSNIDEVIAFLNAGAKSFTVSLRFQNVLEYAHHLHDREAFYVFNDEILEEILSDEFRETSTVLPLWRRDVIERLAEAIGWKYVNFLRSTTEEMRPAIASTEGDRFAHPGGWADRTGNLAAGYRFRVGVDPWTAGETLPEPAKAKVLA